MLNCEFERARVAGIGMTKNTHARVAGEDTLESAFGVIRRPKVFADANLTDLREVTDNDRL